MVRLSESFFVKKRNAFGGQWGEKCCSAAPEAAGYLVTARTESNNEDVSGNHGGNNGWLLKIKF